MVETVEAAGFTVFATGGSSLLQTDERKQLLALDLEREARAVRESYAGRIAWQRAAAVVALAEEGQPDLLVCDEMDFGAVVAAERLGLLHATLECIASGSSFVPKALVLEPLSALRAEHGLPPDPGLSMLGRYLVLSPFPSSFRDPTIEQRSTLHAFRLAGDASGAVERAPAWLDALAPPLAYLTFGTIFNLESGDLFERALAGLRELPGSVVVTVGREIDPGILGAQPANVVVQQFVAQSLLLPRASLVVSHAGSGSVLGALAHGVPMVLLPMGADQPLNAERAEALGVALTLDAATAGAEAIRRAAATVLADASYRLNAERVRDEIAALPGPVHAVALLERLVASRTALPSR
jgi:hypothetical protein